MLTENCAGPTPYFTKDLHRYGIVILSHQQAKNLNSPVFWSPRSNVMNVLQSTV
ncbi:predicted protein [Botrytis cinerea T4]|uniref:Uncharacterized protein n=1 Tax=Botryotinia fuckeliana (strain T4) TaxID=999810 RepID=G2YJK2_BOTF4|nr:predicted protein [Botrytis cinerea T4]